jgi:hypothetical protein
MRHIPIFLLSGFILLSLSLQAQETRFYVPKEVNNAIDSGTRTMTGNPGPAYWHNTVDYDIDVAVDPATRKLTGSEKVVYYNNSPDELGSLVIRLYQDVFREANPRSYRVNPEDINDGVVLSKVVVEGTELDVNDRQSVRRSGTNTTIVLPEPLKSGEKVELEIDWEQFVPKTTVRGGAYDSTSFFVSYWYPQVAVYDDLFGWDQLEYDFSTEFYNNLGNFDVRITVPENFTVLSTGELQNPDAILQPTHLDRYKKAKKSAETISVITPEDLEKGVKHQSGTWHYKAAEVSDFAFCLSDVFCWDAAMQPVEDREVFIHTFYPVGLREQAKEVTGFQQKMMKHFSEDMPGIPYPYPEFCTFISGARDGGMEYPMMANNGTPGLGVTVHEMFHTYFPMYVRINEKRFSWMDEGWASFNTSYIVNRFFREDDSPLFAEFSSQIQGTLGTVSDLPLITSSQFLDNSNYGYASYPLPAFLYSVLLDHLGEEQFKRCYREYIRRWAKKSPTPYDFIYTFESVSGQDLSWFWNPWFFNFGTVGVEIDSYKKGKLTVKNVGTRPVPLTVNIEFEGDGGKERLSYSAGTWKETNEKTIKIPNYKNVASISVNSDVPDANALDNFYPSIKDRYGDYQIPKGLIGRYQLQQFPVPAFFRIQDEVLYLSVPAGGIGNYLLPTGEEDQFITLDGSITIQFNKDGDEYKSVAIETPQITVMGVKE